MPIIVNVDVLLARRKMRLNTLAGDLLSFEKGAGVSGDTREKE